MGTGHADEAVWSDAEARIRAEIRRVDGVVDDLRSGTAHLHWQGPGAGRFRWRTERRVRELHDQRATLTLLLSLCGRAGTAARADARTDARARATADARATAGAEAEAHAEAQGKARAKAHETAGRPC
jgi:hypothetical protein